MASFEILNSPLDIKPGRGFWQGAFLVAQYLTVLMMWPKWFLNSLETKGYMPKVGVLVLHSSWICVQKFTIAFFAWWQKVAKQQRFSHSSILLSCLSTYLFAATDLCNSAHCSNYKKNPTDNDWVEFFGPFFQDWPKKWLILF